MAEKEPERIDIGAEDLPEEAERPPAPDRIVIEADDLPTEEELAPPRTFPGFEGGAPPVGLYVVSHCASRKGEYVLGMAERKEGGYWIQVEKGAPSAGVGRTLSVKGPFVYGPDFACPHCGAHDVLVCECGAVFCHGGKRTATCPVCQRRLRVAGPASKVDAYGGGKGKAGV